MSAVPLRPGMTMGEVFAAAVDAAGDTRIVADGRQATLADIAGRAGVLARRLLDAGAGPGDHVALVLPNSVEYVEAFFAVVTIGGVVVPLDPGLSPRELREAAAAVAVRAVLAEAPQDVPGVPTVPVGADGGGGRGRDQIARQQGTDARFAAVARGELRTADDPAAVFFTSGTTGAPKPVVLSHRQLVRPLVALQRLHAQVFSGSPVARLRRVATLAHRHGRKLLRSAGSQTWLTTSAFRSMAGHQVLTGSLLLGHHLVTTRSFHPRRVLELVDAHNVNVLAGTPAVVELLLRVEDLSPYDLSSLLVIGIGGGPASPDLVDRARRRFDCGVTVGYGSTELGGGVLATRLEDALDTQAQTVGRPFPGAAVRIVDEAGADVAPGRVGELLCRPSGADEGETWLRTGDLAELDVDGNVRIVGRADDLIIRGGQNVHPLEVERVIAELPGVDRCAVVGVPVRGLTGGTREQVWAYVVPDERTALSGDEVRAHCRANLATFRQPDRVRVVAGLPVTEQGEVRRGLLREQAQKEAGHAPGVDG